MDSLKKAASSGIKAKVPNAESALKSAGVPTSASSALQGVGVPSSASGMLKGAGMPSLGNLSPEGTLPSAESALNVKVPSAASALKSVGVPTSASSALQGMGVPSSASGMLKGAGMPSMGSFSPEDTLRSVLKSSMEATIDSLSVAGGFAKGEMRIPLPPELEPIVKKVRKLPGPFGEQARALDDDINAGAEKAVGKAKTIFLETVDQLKLTDVPALLRGGEHALTDFLCKKALPQLTEEVEPILKGALADAEKAVQQLDAYNKLPMAPPITLNLAGFAVKKVLDAVFTILRRKEASARTSNPVLKALGGTGDKAEGDAGEHANGAGGASFPVVLNASMGRSAKANLAIDDAGVCYLTYVISFDLIESAIAAGWDKRVMLLKYDGREQPKAIKFADAASCATAAALVDQKKMAHAERLGQADVKRGRAKSMLPPPQDDMNDDAAALPDALPDALLKDLKGAGVKSLQGSATSPLGGVKSLAATAKALPDSKGVPGLGGASAAKSLPGGKDVPSLGIKDVPSVGGKCIPSLGGKDVPSVGGKDVPSLGGKDVPSVGGKGIPSLGGKDVPVVGGMDVPSLGIKDVPGIGGKGVPSLSGGMSHLGKEASGIGGGKDGLALGGIGGMGLKEAATLGGAGAAGLGGTGARALYSAAIGHGGVESKANDERGDEASFLVVLNGSMGRSTKADFVIDNGGLRYLSYLISFDLIESVIAAGWDKRVMLLKYDGRTQPKHIRFASSESLAEAIALVQKGQGAHTERHGVADPARGRAKSVLPPPRDDISSDDVSLLSGGATGPPAMGPAPCFCAGLGWCLQTCQKPNNLASCLAGTSTSLFCCFRDESACCLLPSHANYGAHVAGSREGVCCLVCSQEAALVKPLCLIDEQPCVKSAAGCSCVESRFSIPMDDDVRPPMIGAAFLKCCDLFPCGCNPKCCVAVPQLSRSRRDASKVPLAQVSVTQEYVIAACCCAMTTMYVPATYHDAVGIEQEGVCYGCCDVSVRQCMLPQQADADELCVCSSGQAKCVWPRVCFRSYSRACCLISRLSTDPEEVPFAIAALGVTCAEKPPGKSIMCCPDKSVSGKRLPFPPLTTAGPKLKKHVKFDAPSCPEMGR